MRRRDDVIRMKDTTTLLFWCVCVLFFLLVLLDRHDGGWMTRTLLPATAASGIGKKRDKRGRRRVCRSTMKNGHPIPVFLYVFFFFFFFVAFFAYVEGSTRHSCTIYTHKSINVYVFSNDRCILFFFSLAFLTSSPRKRKIRKE